MTVSPTEQARGFTLLEAVVALAILAAAGMALFASVSQSMQMLQRADAARVQDGALRNAMALLEQVNPMERPSGTERLGKMEMRWSSVLVEPERDNITGYLQPGLHEVGLYDVTLEVRLDGQPSREYALRRAGYRQVRQPPTL